MRTSHLFGLIGSLLALALLGSQSFAAGERFGARLNNTIQPSNAEQGRSCIEPDDPPFPPCTWVSLEAYNNPDPRGHLAPRNGHIAKIRVVACRPETFVLQIAQSFPGQKRARVSRNGGVIKVQGDPEKCQGETFRVETITLPRPVPVIKNEFLAVQSRFHSMLRCSGGGANILTFIPPLVAGQGFRVASDDDGCFLLIEAVML